MILAAASADVTTYVRLISSVTGAPITGYTITDLDATYIRNRGLAVKTDLIALAGVNAAHGDGVADGGRGIEVDATNAPGLYRVDWPDAAFAAGVDRVQLVVNGANLIAAMEEVQLGTVPADVLAISGDTTAADNCELMFDGTGYAGGAIGLNVAAVTVGAGAITGPSFDTGAIDASAIGADAIGASELAASAIQEIADQVWDELRVGHVAAGSFGEGVSSVQGAVTGAVASVTAGVSLANDAITSAKFDETTAFPLKSADTGSTQVARVGADSDTLETLSDQLDTVNNKVSGVTLTINAPTAADGTVTVQQGDDYVTRLTIAGTWSGEDVSTPTSTTFYAIPTVDYVAEATLPAATITATCTLAISGSTHTVTVPLTAAQTGALTAGVDYTYSVVVVKATKRYTLFVGPLEPVRKVA